MVPTSTAPAFAAPVLIVHPITNENWDISPLLRVMYVLNAEQPGQMAELLYDLARYISSEQYSPQDTSARLRLMLARLDHLGAAFDSVQVLAGSPAVTTVMRLS